MKKNNVFVTGLVIILLILVFPGIIFNQGSGHQNTGFTTPLKGDTIKNRRDFVVSLEIGNFDKTAGHHWVAIASVTGHNDEWQRVLQLYEVPKSERSDSVKNEMAMLVSKWKINQFWPKFYVSGSPYKGHVFDGGQNPLRGLEPQPMILLIIKVDDRLQNDFRQWFRRGSKGQGYPGYSASILSENMVLARCEIFFP